MGLSRAQLLEVAEGADLLLNLAGVLTDEEILQRISVRAFVDLDPASPSSGMRPRASTWDSTATTGSSRSGRRWDPTAAPFRPADARGSRPRRPSCWSTGRWRTRSPMTHSRRSATGAPMAPSTTAASATGRRPTPSGRLSTLPRGRCPLRARARHPPGRDERPRRAPPARLGADRPRRGGRHATPVPGLRAAVVGRVRLGQGGLRRVVMRLVQRPQPLLPGLGPAGPRSGHRLLPVCPHRRGVDRIPNRRRLAAGVESLRCRYEHHRHAARAIAAELFDSDRVLSRLLACL